MLTHSSLQIAKAVLTAGARRTARRAGGGFTRGMLAATAIASPILAYIAGRRAAQTLAPILDNAIDSTLLAAVAIACAGTIGVMFSAWRMEPEAVGLHILAAPVPKPALFAGLIILPLGFLSVTVVLPLVAAGMLGWSDAASLGDIGPICVALSALVSGFVGGALLAEASIGVVRASAQPLRGVIVGAAGWALCGLGGESILLGPVGVLASATSEGGFAGARPLIVGSAVLVAGWTWSAMSRPPRRARYARGMLPVSARGPLTALSSATLAIVFGDAHVRRALGLATVLAVGAGVATLLTGAPAELAIFGASTILTFGVLSVVLIATQMTEPAPWLWRSAPIAALTRLSVSFATAATAALVLCVSAAVAIALGLGAGVSVVIQLVPQFTAAIASSVIVGAVVPRRPGRLLGDLAQFAAAVIISMLVLKAAALAGDGPATQSGFLAIVLAVTVASAARWRAAREELAA